MVDWPDDNIGQNIYTAKPINKFENPHKETAWKDLTAKQKLFAEIKYLRKQLDESRLEESEQLQMLRTTIDSKDAQIERLKKENAELRQKIMKARG